MTFLITLRIDGLQDKIQPLEQVEKDKERLRVKAKKVQSLAAQRHNAPEPNAPALQAENMSIEADRDRVSSPSLHACVVDDIFMTICACKSVR